MKPTRCAWPDNDLLNEYHDREWGVPLHDDQKLFEHLVLDGFQAGLSWDIILKKRENFRRAFAGFDPAKVAGFGSSEIEKLLNDSGIIRNRAKIEAAVSNARAYLKIQEEFGGFDVFVWSFVEGRPIQNAWRSLAEIPSKTEESEKLSRELKKRGFKFVGPTICYAFMQSAGLVNDHTTDCFRHAQLAGATDRDIVVA